MTPAIIVVSCFAATVLAFLVMRPVLREHRKNVTTGRDWLQLLREHPTFSGGGTEGAVEMNVHYAEPSDADLKRLRDIYYFDVVAGSGGEIERIVRLTEWTYRLARHANMPEFPDQRNAFTLIHMAVEKKQNLNCYMKAIILHEALLSMGSASRLTHLLPHSHEEEESHFVNSIYSHTLGRWIFMDADFGTYTTDRYGNILGVMDVRRCLVNGEPLRVKHVGRNVFQMAITLVSNALEGAHYPWFLSEFVFKIRCPKASAFNQESAREREYVELLPDGYRTELLGTTVTTKQGKKITYANDAGRFWAPPAPRAEQEPSGSVPKTQHESRRTLQQHGGS